MTSIPQNKNHVNLPIKARLYGVSVGPGAPDLLTLRAARIISACPVIAYPCAEGLTPFAKSIAAAHLRTDQIEIPLVMPMTADRFPAAEVYTVAAQAIEMHLSEGRDVAVLCEGDSLLYGSFMYLLDRLRHVPVTVVPGVSSIFAVSAAAAYPLVSRNETLSLVSGALGDKSLKSKINSADTVAIFKVGRHFDRLKTLLASMQLLSHSVYVERASLDNELVLPLAQAKGNAPYFSMILVRKTLNL